MTPKFLVDTNVVIAAKKSAGPARTVIQYAEGGRVRLLITQEIMAELSLWPRGVEVWTPGREGATGFSPSALKSYIDKEYGLDGGQRRPPSAADQSLVDAFDSDTTIRGIISDDQRDLWSCWGTKGRRRPGLIQLTSPQAETWVARRSR